MIAFTSTSSNPPARRKHKHPTKPRAKSKHSTRSSPPSSSSSSGDYSSRRAQQQTAIQPPSSRSQYASGSQPLPPIPVARMATPPPPYSLIAPNDNPPPFSLPPLPIRRPLRPLPPPVRASQPVTSSFNNQSTQPVYRRNSADAVPKPPTNDLRQWPAQSTSCPIQDLITQKLCAVITSIDRESFGGDENDLRECAKLLVYCLQSLTTARSRPRTRRRNIARRVELLQSGCFKDGKQCSLVGG